MNPRHIPQAKRGLRLPLSIVLPALLFLTALVTLALLVGLKLSWPWVLAVMLALTLGAGALAATRPKRALRQFLQASQHITSGDFSVRLDENEPFDELAPLAKAFNSTLAALEQRDQSSQRQHAELQALVNLSDALLTSADSNAIIRLALRQAVEALRAPAGAISLAVGQGERFETLHVIGLPEEDFIGKQYPVDAHSAMGYAIMQRRTITSPDLRVETRFQATLNTRRAGVISTISAPMLLAGQVVGAISLATFEERAFSVSDIELLQAIANHTAVAIERLKLVSELSDSYDRTLNALVAALDARDRETEGHSKRVVAYSTALAEAMGAEELLREEIARGALLHDIGKIGVPDAVLHKGGKLSEEEWHVVRRHPEWGRQILGGIGFLRGPAEIVYSHHEHWDGSGYPRGLRGEDIPLGARIFAVVDAFDAMTSYRPYRDPQTFQKARDEIRKATGSQFDPSVVEAFMKFSKDDWAALREASETKLADGRSSGDMGSLRRIGSGQLQALNVIIAAITSSLDLGEVQQRCVDALMGVTRAVSAAVYTCQGDELAFAAGANMPAALMEASGSRLAELLGVGAIREGITRFFPSLAADMDARARQLHELNPDWGSVLILPMPAGDQSMGALALFSRKEHSFDDDERAMFDHIAKQLAQALVNAQAHERVRVQAITDGLTGAYNRHYLDDFLSIEVKRCTRYRRPLAVLMLDLDHFRLCNERAGHQGGDRALQDTVHLMNLGVRSVDLVARYGGEEFTVVLPETDLQGAFEVAERMRYLVEGHTFPCGKLTASIGVAAFSYQEGDAPDAAELIRRADQALYQAKQTGRNRVIAWEAQPAMGAS